jgi:hypothetical protein
MFRRQLQIKLVKPTKSEEAEPQRDIVTLVFLGILLVIAANTVSQILINKLS